MKSPSFYGFGMTTAKEEGAPIDPLEALLFTGPGATPTWFANQCEAWFKHQRSKGVSEEILKQHPYYTRRTR
jgi:hypothetical protein